MDAAWKRHGMCESAFTLQIFASVDHFKSVTCNVPTILKLKCEELHIFPSGHTMALGWDQSLTKMSSRNTSWGVQAAGA